MISSSFGKDSSKKYYAALIKEEGGRLRNRNGKLKVPEIGKRFTFSGFKRNKKEIPKWFYCENIYVLAGYYDPARESIFEIEPDGRMLYNEKTRTYTSHYYTVLRELSDEEIQEMVDSFDQSKLINGDTYERAGVAMWTDNEEYLDILREDKSKFVRNAIERRP